MAQQKKIEVALMAVLQAGCESERRNHLMTFTFQQHMAGTQQRLVV
jgi:hypothetical protein